MYASIGCKGGISNSDYVNADNIESFRGCSIIYGHLRLTQSTLLGSVYYCMMEKSAARQNETAKNTFSSWTVVFCYNGITVGFGG